MGPRRDIDTYFQVPQGRLKLRQTEGSPHGALIYYERPDRAESRYSRYHLVTVHDPEETRTLLHYALGTLVTVTKTRRLFLYGATRIHLDQVEGLGNFVELETAMPGLSEEQARTEHELVKQALALDHRETVPTSYSDLLLLEEPRLTS